MRSFEIRRRNVLLKHALAKARFAVVYIRMRSTSSFRSHTCPGGQCQGCPDFFREREGIRLLVFDVGEILRYTSKASLSLSSSPWSAGQIVGLED
jgi:hypothetical protein